MMIWFAALTAAVAVLAAARRASPGQRLTGLGAGARAGPAPAAPGSGTPLLLAGVAGTAVAAAPVPNAVPVVVVLVAVAVARIRSWRRSARLREAAALAAVEVTAALAAELRSGRTPSDALTAVGPWSGPLAPALSSGAAAVAAGLPAADALLLAAAVPGAGGLCHVAAAWRVTEATGGRLAGVLDRLAGSLDEERAMREELDSALAGPRATVVLLAGLPVMGLSLGQAVGAHPFRLLVDRPLGWGLLGAAAVLDGVGVVVMTRITRWAIQW